MTPNEIALKFASASATCKNGKCPFNSECRGTTETCKMKEVAMIIRAMMAEIATLEAKYNALDVIAKASLGYMTNLEKINKYYYDLCSRFQNGYRPKKKIVKRDARVRQKKKPIDPVKMDGKERYAYDEPKEKTELPVVII